MIRGGYGRYFQFPLGMAVVGGWAVSASAVTAYQQQYDSGSPALSFPSPFPENLASTGTQTFDYAVDPNYQDPVINQWTLTVERDLGFDTGLRVSYVGSHTGNLPVRANLNQVAANTQGYAAVADTRPFPLFDEISWIENGARANYNALTVEANHRYSGGLQFDSSYTFARNLSSEAGAAPSAFANEQGGRPSNTNDLNLDYGNVAFTRRHRFLTTFLWEMPFGSGKRFNMGSKLLNAVVGDWNMGGVLVIQSGPFLTPTARTDPSGTDAQAFVGNGRADVVPGVSLYGDSSNPGQYINPAAFAVPANNIGRWGTAAVGSIVGPGTRTLSLSLMKGIPITESVRMQFGAQVSNILNHRNYAPPSTSNMVVGTSGFGTLTALQTADSAGPRSVLLTGRFTF